MVDWWTSGVGRVVESSNGGMVRGVVSSEVGGVVESSNGGMAEVVELSDRRIVESSNGRMVELWSW